MTKSGKSLSKLERLILLLKEDKKRGSTALLKVVDNPALLIKSLEDLNGMLGNAKAKDDVAEQVSHLLQCKIRKTVPKEMLNFVIHGPPGCGKTLLGAKLARIFYALGLVSKKEAASGLPAALSGLTSDAQTTYIATQLFITLAPYVYSIVSFVFLALIACWSKMPTLFAIVGVVILLAIGIAWWFFYTDAKKETVDTGQMKVSKPVLDEDILMVVKKDDLVGKYVGHTAPKTKKVLMEAKGKILFIDEAYQILNTNDDPFGIECLNVINQHISENPANPIIIFSGYKDKLAEGIFTVQPGLRRRIMFWYESEGYNIEQLYEIFKLQLQRDKWEVIDDEDILRLFLRNADAFPSYGGDTERLAYFAKVVHDSDVLFAGSSGNSKIGVNHVKLALDKLRQNSFDVEVSKKDRLDDVLRNYFKGGESKTA